MIKCKICNKECKNYLCLSNHVRKHKITTKEYYDKYLKKEDEGICPECGKETTFFSLNKGYQKHCSCRCNSHSEERKQNSLKKWGVENPMQSKEIKEKMKQTCLERYGVKSSNQAKIVKEKKKQTFIRKYGVDNPAKSLEVQEVFKQTCLKRHGTESPLQNNIVKEKSKQTFIRKYGVENFNQKHITNFDKYTDRKFIRENFLTDKKHIKCKEMMEFFNIGESCVFKQFKKLEIEYIKWAGTSQYEEEIYNFLHCELGILNIKQNDRQLIKPAELDFFLPDYELAIEFNGIYWHTEQAGKDKYYHIAKTNACESEGVQLIHIWESEWVLKKEIMKSILKAKLGKLDKLCGARQTVVREIDTGLGRCFLDENHIQGKDNARLRLGAFYKEELVATMSFKVTSNGRDKDTTCDWILSRFCTKINCNIPGMASKLFAYFKNNYEWKGVKSLADKRISDGGLYGMLGFDTIIPSPPTYFYVDKDDMFSISNKSNFQRKHIENKWNGFNPDETEFQNMDRWGKYFRIWNCGYITYKNIKEK